MKVLVVPGSGVVGGSEINAVDLAAGIRDLGHDVVVYAKAGPVSQMAARQHLRVLTASYPLRRRPSPRAVLELRRLLRHERPDLVHTYEGYSCTEALYALGLGQRTAQLATIYTMFVDTYVPRSVPFVMGTQLMQEEQARTRMAAVFRLDPPIDTALSCEEHEGPTFRTTYEVDSDTFLAVMTSRLDFDMKFDSLHDAIRAVCDLCAEGEDDVHLVVVGDGPARQVLEDLAEALAPAGRARPVTFTGHMTDPRPAYRAADVVLGMGTSVVRGMSSGAPAILVGEAGHVELLEPGTVGPYLRQGFWAVGSGEGGPARITEALRRVRDMGPARRQELGTFGRALVLEHYDLSRAVLQLEGMYRAALGLRAPRRELVADMLATAPRVLAFKVRHRLRRLREQRSGGQPPAS